MRIDTIFDNAHFITMNPTHPRATRLGVLNGRIVGLDDDLDGIDAREHVDLGGACVVPGFNDVHIHIAWLGRTLREIDLTDLSDDMETVYSRIAERISSDGLSEQDWVLCSGFDHHRFHGQYPSIARLDAVCANRPLFMRHTSGHSSIANTAALNRIGALSPDFHDPEGGHVVRDAEGNPTGLVQENAQILLQDLFKPYSVATMEDAIERAQRRLASEGITSVSDAGIGAGWIGDSPIQFLAYQNLYDTGRLSVRSQVMPTIYNLHDIDHADGDPFGLGIDLGIRSKLGDDWLSLGPVKVFTDGSLSGETAAMTVPYRGQPQNVGSLENSPESLRTWILGALRSGWSVAAHAIGDRGVDTALDTYETALGRGIVPPLPLRIEHAGVMRDDQLDRIARLGIVPTTQSAFFDNIGDGMLDSLEPDVVEHTYRGKSLLDKSIVLPGSSDAPCASDSALLGIEKFVTRATASGRIFGPASECLSVAEALRCYTVGSAQATGFANSKGCLKPGFLADFTCLGENILSVPSDEISHIPVLATVVGGRFTFRR